MMSHTIASSGLRENVILTKIYLFVPKYGRKLWHQCGAGRIGGHPGRNILTKMCVHPSEQGPCGHGQKIWEYHCRWRAGMSCSTSSLLCVSWYFSRFLLKGGSLTDEHSLLYGPKETLGLPVYNGEIVQFDGMTCGVGMVIEGEGAVRCSLYLSLNVLHLCTTQMVTHIPVYRSPLLVMVSLSLGATNRSLIVLPPLNWTWTAALLQILLKALNKSF